MTPMAGRLWASQRTNAPTTTPPAPQTGRRQVVDSTNGVKSTGTWALASSTETNLVKSTLRLPSFPTPQTCQRCQTLSLNPQTIPKRRRTVAAYRDRILSLVKPATLPAAVSQLNAKYLPSQSDFDPRAISPVDCSPRTLSQTGYNHT
ncbi:hypothetical protein E4U43_004274 [Claviceps pusilla]|uniref:Uncharacterized protein n=1 Tax=Claviceps pusilla TaxID=123648 RepID=A0A9P7NHJ1_9HYPO|nr:hypothetical protein E4U43_004274 [Claviceps pusilla]